MLIQIISLSLREEERFGFGHYSVVDSVTLDHNKFRTHRSCRRRPGSVRREAKPVQHSVSARRRTSNAAIDSRSSSFDTCARRSHSSTTTTVASGRRALAGRARRGRCWDDRGLGFGSLQGYDAGCSRTSSACCCCCCCCCYCCSMASCDSACASRPRQAHRMHGRSWKQDVLRMADRQQPKCGVTARASAEDRHDRGVEILFFADCAA